MKISPSNLPLPNDQTASATGTSRAAARSVAGPSAPSQPTGASSTAQASAPSAASVASVSSDFNAQKVQTVSAAVANGTYRANAGAIADKMLSGVAELSRRKN
jgi:negative regulator of flagellin synthesis FlgM